MAHFENWQILCVLTLFIWSGFVRSGLGFGGAALTLPLLLIVENNPLLFLPIIGVHLLIFSSHAIYTCWSLVNWQYLYKLLVILIIPKIAGVMGLLSFSAEFMSGFVYVVTLMYSLGYIFNFKFQGSAYLDLPLLVIGGYVSGASLIGAPLIVAVAVRHLSPEAMRPTLFVLWFLMVCVKLTALVLAGVDLQFEFALYLLPFAAIGHFLGLYFNKQLINKGRDQFIRFIGVALMIISLMGLYRLY